MTAGTHYLSETIFCMTLVRAGYGGVWWQHNLYETDGILA
jgi:hypothetical protein